MAAHKAEYTKALKEANLFTDSAHRSRFEELMNCYEGYPFFTPGLAKCIYFSAMDDEHFAVMLGTLGDMTIAREESTDEMMYNADSLSEDAHDANDYDEAYLYKFSMALLEGGEIDILGMDKLSDENVQKVQLVLKAAKVIDAL